MNFPRWLTPWRKHTDQNAVTPIRAPYGFPSRFGWIGESFTGSWQANLTLSPESQLAFSAVFACVSLRSRDIAKLRIRMMRRAASGIWEEAESSAFSRLLRKPNRYQTWLQFIQEWIISKLTWGNTYVLKDRDRRGMVEAMYILNPASVRPLVAPDGEVYYQLGNNRLAGLPDGNVTLPASEIIHDRGECLFHPLVGVPPLYAAGMAATQGTRIQANSQRFFENMSRPGGHLTAPGTIPDATATRLKEQFEGGFSGINVGRLFVSGDGLKFEPFSVPADDAQLIEQLKWTGEDVARAFLVPAYKIGLGPAPSLGHVAALNQEYYQQALQADIEAIEALLDIGLDLPADLFAEFDLELLLRMDPKTRAEVTTIEVSAGVRAPNEARFKLNLKPVKGGESPYLQQQNYSLEALAKRDAQEDPFRTAPPPAPPPPDPDAANDEDAKEVVARLVDERLAAAKEGFVAKAAEAALTVRLESLEALVKALPAPAPAPAPAKDDEDDDDAEKMAAEIADVFIKGLMQDVPAPVSDARLLEVDSQIRASVGILAALASTVAESQKQVDSTMEVVVTAARHTEQSQARVAKSVDELSATLKMPVVPVFDKDGMLKGSRRVEKLEEE